MKIYPIVSPMATVRNYSNKQNVSFNGHWNTEKLNILGRDKFEMEILGRYFWSAPERVIEEASTIRNFLGIKKSSASKEAYQKLKAAQKNALNEMNEIIEPYSNLISKNPRTPEEEREFRRLEARYKLFPDDTAAKREFYEGSDSSGSGYADNMWEPWNNTY